MILRMQRSVKERVDEGEKSWAGTRTSAASDWQARERGTEAFISRNRSSLIELSSRPSPLRAALRA